jgi:signal transduction histidine kinase
MRRYAAISGSIESSPAGGREVVVRVRDNGLGVPLDRRRSLFQRFYRAHDMTTTRADGTGLGLSIVSETVASLGGRAWAEFPGTGSVFAFSLPYRRVQTSDAA